MRGIWEAYGGKREAKGSQKGSLVQRISEARRNARGQGAYLSAYKQTYMPAYTAFLLPSANGSTRPASLQAGGAPNLIAPRIPPGQDMGTSKSKINTPKITPASTPNITDSDDNDSADYGLHVAWW